MYNFQLDSGLGGFQANPRPESPSPVKKTWWYEVYGKGQSHAVKFQIHGAHNMKQGAASAQLCSLMHSLFGSWEGKTTFPFPQYH